MKHINKTEPIKEFQSFVKTQRPETWNEIRKHNPTLSSSCRKYILETEQHNLSGYTEKKLDFNSKGIHVDHFRKRSLFPALTFEWNNLIVDEHNPNYGADYKDQHINQTSQYDILINPVQEDLYNFFTYLENGKVIAKSGLSEQDREKAIFTIATFNLNNISLVEQRSNLITIIHYYTRKDQGLESSEIIEILKDQGFISLVEWFCANKHL